MNLLSLKDISVKKNGNTILNGLNLSVQKGDIHVILGVNGVGKSTLALAIMGITKYTGKIILENRDISKLSITKRAKLGIRFMRQTPPSFEGIKIREYIKIDSNLGIEEIKKTLKKVGLPESYSERFLDDTLSGGERKRVELAAIIASHPKLAILDEPDSGIDIISINKIKSLIKELNKNGTTVVLITHREEITSIATKASLMCNGKIVKSGTPRDINKLFKKDCKGAKL